MISSMNITYAYTYKTEIMTETIKSWYGGSFEGCRTVEHGFTIPWHVEGFVTFNVHEP